MGDWQGLGDDFSHFDFACPAQGSYWSRAAYNCLGGTRGKDPITGQGKGSVSNGSRGGFRLGQGEGLKVPSSGSLLWGRGAALPLPGSRWGRRSSSPFPGEADEDEDEDEEGSPRSCAAGEGEDEDKDEEGSPRSRAPVALPVQPLPGNGAGRGRDAGIAVSVSGGVSGECLGRGPWGQQEAPKPGGVLGRAPCETRRPRRFPSSRPACRGPPRVFPRASFPSRASFLRTRFRCWLRSRPVKPEMKQQPPRSSSVLTGL